MAPAPKPIRCAIYTRKSTEYGLELEFNSLDAQREACDAYIKSQASQGWRVVTNRYDDPAFSGGNLERPALQRLLKDIDVGKVDVVVVYKIDRLTRSLADFAKLVELFDAKSVSFVAVTQQFNTTSSMGRLTLNVLLSFAQFERELSSERVRDKVAASRAKGKWTGGSVPLGYDAINKTLIPNRSERETVRYIFRRYLELNSMARLIEDLDKKKITTKTRNTKDAIYRGGSLFTYGPLAYLLRNRIYIGEMGHKGKWFPGEHEPIIDREVFDQTQALFKLHDSKRIKRQSESGALLMGKLFDDRGNIMSPSYSIKNGVRYRFYVSSALVKGRKETVGSVGRVSANEVEEAVLAAVATNRASEDAKQASEHRASIMASIERCEISATKVTITLVGATNGARRRQKPIEIPWQTPKSRPATSMPVLESSGTPQDAKVLQSIVRAKAWVAALEDGRFQSIEELAPAVSLNPKVVRQQIQYAFLSPANAAAAIAGGLACPDTIGLKW